MKLSPCCAVAISLLALVVSTTAQTSPSNSQTTSASTQVPRLIRFSGIAKDETGKPLSGVLGITFALYQDEQGGAPLWLETQNVQADTNGHYTVMLGSDKPEGLSLDLFTSGEARWLGVKAQGQPEQPRVLLVSVPYAIKAHEAETLSGRTISDFVLNDTKTLLAGTSNKQMSSNSAGSPSQTPTNGPTNFAGSNTTQIVGVTQTGTGTGLSATATTHAAVAGTITGASNTAVYGLASNTSPGSSAAGVTGAAKTQFGPGVQGVTTSSSGFGVQGVVNSTSGGTAVQGLNNAISGVSQGVSGQTSSVTANSSGVNGYEGAATGQVYGVNGSTNSTTNYAAGVSGYEGAATGTVFGVKGGTNSSTPGAAAVNGFEGATTGQVFGVSGGTNSTSPGAAAVNGYEGAATGQVYGVNGSTNSTTNYAAGVSGYEGAATGAVFGVKGGTNSTTNFAAGVSGYEGATGGGTVFGVTGSTNSATSGSSGLNGYEGAKTGGPVYGVSGYAESTGGIGVFGSAQATSGFTVGVEGATSSPGGTAGQFVNISGSGKVLLGQSGSNYNTIFSVDASGNGSFAGNLNVTGKLTKGSGSFKIDDPLDPAHKYLSHSFVESPDMMNVYNGNVTTDKHGLATVVLPDYFEALNRDFRYQLTVIGQFAQAIVQQEIKHNRFTIKTSKSSVKVSWQVTGIRHDAYADAYRIPVEEEKPPQEQGHYLHPELFGTSEHQAIGAAVPVPSTGSAPPTRASTINLFPEAGSSVK